MNSDLTPIERNKKKMKTITWVLSILAILIISIIVCTISYI